jgi:hypothetical protein
MGGCRQICPFRPSAHTLARAASLKSGTKRSHLLMSGCRQTWVHEPAFASPGCAALVVAALSIVPIFETSDRADLFEAKPEKDRI